MSMFSQIYYIIFIFFISVKDEAVDDSDNLAALTDSFKEEDLKTFDDACNDFNPNGKLISRNFQKKIIHVANNFTTFLNIKNVVKLQH